ncbi:MAG: dTDP-4-dehydrorhamnose reductase [Bacteroidales bacterium]|nr:dTDP-4-dehydrorhamnose reductase [Bacteroidales bacterium]MDD2425932.1 dTDP-4-dehydrorhamnose reductase [Bacteroidales bacterium]MDD3990040.1 dTDP-4-dehydrorhamnose reductase [Bacteroidales bacterium]
MSAILITGACGQLGSELRERERVFRSAFEQSDKSETGFTKIFFTDIKELDICDQEAVNTFVQNNGITHIINCAAYTAVDRAEDDLTGALKLNGFAPGYLAAAMKSVNGYMLHISTDYVFDGNGPLPYREEERTSPLTTYGRTKLEGEKAVIATGCRHNIIRTSWLYSCYGSNFVKTILRLAIEKESINVVFDQIGSPTYAGDLAESIIKIVSLSGNIPPCNQEERNWEDYIYHYSNEGVCSWYDLAYETIRLAKEKWPEESGYRFNCKVLPVTSDKFPAPAKRPSFSLLNKDKVKAAFSLEIPHWRSSLEKCIRNMKTQDFTT